MDHIKLYFVGENPDNVSRKSAKFWEAEREGQVLTRRWGKLGTAGQTKVETFPSSWDAKRVFLKLAEEKTEKGYVIEVDAIKMLGSLS